jgi:hypothetical protein
MSIRCCQARLEALWAAAVVVTNTNAATVMMTRFTGESYHVPDGREVHSPAMKPVAFFVSPHGFGHAARACAVMAEMRRQCPAIHFEVFTEVPRWFFSESLPRCFSYHHLASDVGLVQRSPLIEDLEATIDRLDEMWHDSSEPGRIGDRLRELGCSIVVCDISPLGLAAATAASLPSVLVENFTWDWIYARYPDAPSRLREHGRRLAEIFASADLRIQTDPISEHSPAAVSVRPVARSPRVEKEAVCATLGVPAADPMIVVSMGGVPWDYEDFSDFDHLDGAWVVVPGGSEIYHPDLVAAADLVVSKLGYSTVAETFRAGAALAYVGRPRFPESPILARWVEGQMVAAEITEEALRDGTWIGAVDVLLESPRRKPDEPNGAVLAADAILEKFGSVYD